MGFTSELKLTDQTDSVSPFPVGTTGMARNQPFTELTEPGVGIAVYG